MTSEIPNFLDWIKVLIAHHKSLIQDEIADEQNKKRPLGGARDMELSWRKGYLNGLGFGLNSLSSISTSINERQESASPIPSPPDPTEPTRQSRKETAADKIRERTLELYEKHRLEAEKNPEPPLLGTNPHEDGLYGALSRQDERWITLDSRRPSRKRTAGLAHLRDALWAELIPFRLFPRENAVRLLAEYIVYRELPLIADAETLRVWMAHLFWESGIARLTLNDDPHHEIFSLWNVAVQNEVPWVNLVHSGIWGTFEQFREQLDH